MYTGECHGITLVALSQGRHKECRVSCIRAIEDYPTNTRKAEVVNPSEATECYLMQKG